MCGVSIQNLECKYYVVIAGNMLQLSFSLSLIKIPFTLLLLTDNVIMLKKALCSEFEVVATMWHQKM